MSNHHHHHHSERKEENKGMEEGLEVMSESDVAPEIEAEEEVQNGAGVESEVEGDERVTEDNSEGETPDSEVEQEKSGRDDSNDEDGAKEEASATSDEASSKSKETDWRDAYVRLAADFDNYRKRTAKEQDDVRRRERERVVNLWLDVYDNAERALSSLPEKEGPWYEGFVSLVHQMDKCLAMLQIKACDDMGKKFDPKRHEAIATCPNPSMENNTIMHIERRGFEYENGDIARVARVIVVRNPS